MNATRSRTRHGGGAGRRASGDGQDLGGEVSDGGLALAGVDAEGGADPAGSEVVERLADVRSRLGDDLRGGAEPEAAEERPVAGEGAVDEGADALLWGAGGGPARVVQGHQRAVPGVESGLPQRLGDGEALVAKGDLADNAEQGIGSLVGGVSEDDFTKPENNFTPDQFKALARLLSVLRKKYPDAVIQGHRDFPKVTKACPSFSVKEWLKGISE